MDPAQATLMGAVIALLGALVGALAGIGATALQIRAQNRRSLQAQQIKTYERATLEAIKLLNARRKVLTGDKQPMEDPDTAELRAAMHNFRLYFRETPLRG